jgi:hypothetical protein
MPKLQLKKIHYTDHSPHHIDDLIHHIVVEKGMPLCIAMA